MKRLYLLNKIAIMKGKLLLLATFICSISLNAQTKKLVDYHAYEGWKSIKGSKVSQDGNWVSYEVNPAQGDGKLFLYDVKNNKLDSFERGYSAEFFDNGKSFIYKIKPPYLDTRKAKLEKKKPDEQPKDTLIVLNLENKNEFTYANVKNYEVAYESYMWVWEKDKVKEKPSTNMKQKKKKKKKKKKEPEIKSEGSEIHLMSEVQGNTYSLSNLMTNMDSKLIHVTEYKLSKKGDLLVAVVKRNVDKVDSAYIYVAQKGDNKNFQKKFSYQGNIKSIAIDDAGTQVSFLASADTAKVKVYDLYYWKTDYTAPSLVVDRNNSAMKKNWSVNENQTPFFSENGKRIFFGTNMQPVNEPKDTLLEEEKYKLDLWSYTDKRLQPHQLKELSKDNKKSFLAVYHIADNKMVQICDSIVDNYKLVLNGDGDVALGISDIDYQNSWSWDSPWPSDYYTIDLLTGEKTEQLHKHGFNAELSVTGKYLIWYQRKVDHWFAMNIKTGDKWNITGSVKDIFYVDDNGNPEEENAFGIMGWSENDEFVYIYSKYDIWKVNPENLKMECLTDNKNNLEKNDGTKYTNVVLDKEEKFINDKFLLLHTFNDETKKAGFAKLIRNTTDDYPSQIIEDDKKFYFIGKAKNSDVEIFAASSFTQYPDLMLTKLFDFPKASKISNANPQQAQYNWGTAELTSWTSPEGKNLKGIIYKPENFSKDSIYPLLVYFYELYSDDIHNYYSPRPSASIINPTEYASNGYVVFFPDIKYDEGTPGDNAYDCIVSGTEHILSMGYTNRNRIGIQGQSWGGYQTAYLITRTTMFTAAMAGAPVSNMTSAYGGIRWGSGLSRAFQYEKGQSRIGKTLWEDRERYIYNSPLFFADKVQTPLLIMHNDEDGAVPWYQGIEYFSGLRRLNKPVWMLTYNGDDHNLRKWPNKMDLSIRMRGFFDYYLLDKPMPKWMNEGISAQEKGKVNKYETIERK